MNLGARTAAWSGGGSSPLPPEYRQVLSLNGAGAQFIDIGDIGTYDTLELVASNIPNGSSYYALCGQFNGASAKFEMIRKENTKTTYEYADRSSGYTTVSDVIYDSGVTRFFVDIASKTFLVNNANGTYSAVNSSLSGIITTGRHYMFFCASYGSTPNYWKCGYNFLGFIVTYGGAEKIHLCPCVRKTDEKPGLYDSVSGTFYTNIGTGTDFTVTELT